MASVMYDDESSRWIVFLDSRDKCKKTVVVHMSDESAEKLQGTEHEVGSAIMNILSGARSGANIS